MATTPTPPSEADDLLGRLRERGWRVTPQRRAVVGALDGQHVHRTAEQIHGAARSAVPEVSLATVYNTLNELVAMGEISEMHLRDGTTRYDPKVGPDHHHLICSVCGAVYDVDPAGIVDLHLPSDQHHGMRVDAVEVTFHGVCAACR